jgi:hypothetical protein
MTVYVVQESMRRDPNTRELVPVHDLTPARVFGDVVVLLSPSAMPFGQCSGIVSELHDKLSKYDAERDWILPMGNPVLIGWAMAVATEYGEGRVRALVWNSRTKRYTPTDAQIFDCQP